MHPYIRVILSPPRRAKDPGVPVAEAGASFLDDKIGKRETDLRGCALWGSFVARRGGLLRMTPVMDFRFPRQNKSRAEVHPASIFLPRENLVYAAHTHVLESHG